MDGGERGMNPTAMTIINPRKEYRPSWGSNQRPPVLMSCMLPTELWGSCRLWGHIDQGKMIRTNTKNVI